MTTYYPKPGDIVSLLAIHPGEADYDRRDEYENLIYQVNRFCYTDSNTWVYLENVFGKPFVRHFDIKHITLTPIAL